MDSNRPAAAKGGPRTDFCRYNDWLTDAALRIAGGIVGSIA